MTIYHIYYALQPTFDDTPINPRTLDETHALVYMLNAASLDEIFTKMQAENMTPNQALVIGQSAGHTSMSVGDLAVLRNPQHVWLSGYPICDKPPTIYQCMTAGWQQIKTD